MDAYIYPGIMPYKQKMIIKQCKTRRLVHENATAELIVNSICEIIEISLDDLTGKIRQHEFVEPRRIAVYLLSKHTKLSLAEIGFIFNSDHSFVIYHRERCEELMSIEPKLKDLVCGLINQLKLN